MVPTLLRQPAVSAMALPALPINVRPGTMDDLPFIDGLQKKTTKQVGWMPTKQFEGKIAAGHVLVAETPPPQPSPGVPGEGVRALGYLIGHDQYFKRDDVGIIYQINVVPGVQRGLIGATLLKAQFDRSAYGCRLYCCWCAQDIAANHFWQAMGFVPLAYRAGSEKKSRIHIFWQKRIRAGDEETPWWFPSKTDAGAMREDRIVLPIPPGLHWSDEMPLIVPIADCQVPIGESKKALPEPRKKRGRALPLDPPTKHGPRQFGAPSSKPMAAVPVPVQKAEAPAKRESKPKVKADPKLVAAARELRDRWLEAVNRGEYVALPMARYEVSREISGQPMVNQSAIGGVPGEGSRIALLPAA